MGILNHNVFPPNGWVYRERIAGKYWSVPDPLQPLDVCSIALFNARRNNKVSTTLEECRKAISDYTCRRLDNDTRFCESTAEQVKIREAKEARPKRSCCGRGKKK